MATDYFAHCFYGIHLDDRAYDELSEMLEKYAQSLDEAAYEDFMDSSRADRRHQFVNWMNEEKKDWVEETAARLGAPAGVGICYTGDEDDRPGRCHTEPDLYLLGLGIFAVIGRPELVGWDEAMWHGWVTAS